MKIKIFTILFFTSYLIGAQNTVSSNAELFSNSDGDINYTLGGGLTGTLGNINGSLNIGFYQIFDSVVLSVSTIYSEIDIKLFPNPTSKIVNFVLNDDNYKYNYKLINSSGKVIEKGIFDTKSNQIDISKNAAGVYYINILVEQLGRVKTFKIIKK